MAHNPIHDFLDMAFRKIGGDKKAYQEYKKEQRREKNWAKGVRGRSSSSSREKDSHESLAFPITSNVPGMTNTITRVGAIPGADALSGLQARRVSRSTSGASRYSRDPPGGRSRPLIERRSGESSRDHGPEMVRTESLPIGHFLRPPQAPTQQTSSSRRLLSIPEKSEDHGSQSASENGSTPEPHNRLSNLIHLSSRRQHASATEAKQESHPGSERESHQGTDHRSERGTRASSRSTSEAHQSRTLTGMKRIGDMNRTFIEGMIPKEGSKKVLRSASEGGQSRQEPDQRRRDRQAASQGVPGRMGLNGANNPIFGNSKTWTGGYGRGQMSTEDARRFREGSRHN